MTTSRTPAHPPTVPEGSGLRILFSEDRRLDGVDGWWWPRSRQLRQEGADLVDHFPPERGRVSRLLFSRPDWDDGAPSGRGLRKIVAARGPVKVGSFPRDDTGGMVLAMSMGRDVRLAVVHEPE